MGNNGTDEVIDLKELVHASFKRNIHFRTNSTFLWINFQMFASHGLDNIYEMISIVLNVFTQIFTWYIIICNSNLSVKYLVKLNKQNMQ